MKEDNFQTSKQISTRIIVVGVVVVILALVLIYLTFAHLMVPMKVVGTSMMPTLHDKDMVYVNKLYTSLDYGDIVVFNHGEPEKLSVKRVLGRPDDIMSVVDGKLWRNGIEVANDYSDVYLAGFKETGAPDVNDRGEYAVPKESYFLIGDNRANSLDSRYYGSVREKDIVGKMNFVK